MTDLIDAMEPRERCAISVRFPGSFKIYDYFATPPIRVGQQVVVETSRGEATVPVVEVKDTSDRASKSILRIAIPGTDY